MLCYSVFQVLSVQVSDMAGYLCVAENKVGAVEKLFSLTVQGQMEYKCPSNTTLRGFFQFTQEGQGYFLVSCECVCVIVNVCDM